MISKGISYLSIACCLVLAVACSPQVDTLQPVTADVQVEQLASVQQINWNLGAQPVSLDPQHCCDPYARQVIHQLYCGLFAYRGQALVNAICQTYDVSEDRLFYRFYLRESYWSDGEALTAQDFVYAWSRWSHPEFSVKAIGTHQLDVQLIAADPHFLTKLASYRFVPVKRTAVVAGRNWHQRPGLVSNGPFKLEEYNANQSYLLRKNTMYYNAPSVKLNAIILHMITEDHSKLLAYKTNRVQLIDDISPKIAASLRLLDNQRVEHRIDNTTYLRFNTVANELPYAVRQALYNGVDRAAVAQVAGARAKQAATGLIPPGVTFHSQSFRAIAGDYQVDVQEARPSASLSVSQQRTTVRLIARNHLLNSQLVQYLRVMWRHTTGIDVDISLLNWLDFQTVLKRGDYDIALIHDRYNAPSVREYLLHYSQLTGERETSKWLNDKLLTKTTTEENVVNRTRLMLAERFLIDQALVVPLYYSRQNSLVSPRIRQLALTPLGVWDFTVAYLTQ